MVIHQSVLKNGLHSKVIFDFQKKTIPSLNKGSTTLTVYKRFPCQKQIKEQTNKLTAYKSPPVIVSPSTANNLNSVDHQD